jgi:hypothetical protein
MRRRVIQHSFIVGLVAVLLGCGRNGSWPPPPRNQQEARMINSALRAVDQIDGWSQVACVVERRKKQWRVQAWRIVKPEARGRDRCVPWAVRGITLNEHAEVLSYENQL